MATYQAKVQQSREVELETFRRRQCMFIILNSNGRLFINGFMRQGKWCCTLLLVLQTIYQTSSNTKAKLTVNDQHIAP